MTLPLLDNKILILILINRNFFKWQKYVNFKPESDEILILRYVLTLSY